MSKIICDVCGTAYPETASQCPICGCAKPEGIQTVSDDDKVAGGMPARSYTYVKGGRFSKSNVRKRNRAGGSTPTREKNNDEMPVREGKSSNWGLTIAVIVLLLAILAVVFYAGYHFFWQPADPGSDGGTTAPESTSAPDSLEVPCTGLILEQAVVELDGEGRSWLLNVTPEPVDTTDAVTYSSSDESVATVTSEGRVTAVGPGQAVILITCGDVTKECRVVCAFEPDPTGETTDPVDDPTDPTDEPTDPVDDPTDPPAPSGDYTIHVYYGTSPYYDKQTQTVEAMIKVGESFPLNIRDSSGNYVDVTWTASNDCCTVSGNTVTGASPGSVRITTTYDGITFTCKVVVN